MDVIEKFSKTAALICEPVRSKILWALLDGRAYTATELSTFADISVTSASNHLAKLLDGKILKVENQGRHRYFSFASDDVAYAVEALAQLSNPSPNVRNLKPTGIKYCRTCYDHLAGYIGVLLVEAMEDNDLLKKDGNQYLITKKGWEWFGKLGIFQSDYENIRRPLTRQCLDWSERRNHLAGKLGADLMEIMMQRKWFTKVQFSRELFVTSKGRQEIYELLRVTI